VFEAVQLTVAVDNRVFADSRDDQLRVRAGRDMIDPLAMLG
jgi:hypothetical protein